MKTREIGSQMVRCQPAAASGMLTPVQAVQTATVQLVAQQIDVDQSPRMLLQRRVLDAAFGGAIQRQTDGLEEDEPVQTQAAPVNETGMPNQLKAGIESLSGMDMSDVRVHRNSDKPAQLNALAYAQGNDIHLGPGQEQHLPHEAWHVVQQRQGRVRETVQMAGVGVNDDVLLEREADVMGERSLTQGAGIYGGAQEASADGLGAEPAMQMKTAAQAGIVKNPLVTFKETLSGNEIKSEVESYIVNIGDGATKIDALLESASDSGEVGKNVREYVGKNGSFTGEGNLGKDKVSTLDPFVYITNNHYDGDKQLLVGYQYGKNLSGYVRGIEDLGNIPQTYSRMYHDEEERLSIEKKGFSAYHTQHQKIEEKGKIVDHLDGSSESSLDAYTKIAGEGARFLCVRDHAKYLADDSIFYIKSSDDDYIGITFLNLYVTWKTTFGGRFNIPNEDIVDRLEKRSFKTKSRGGKKTKSSSSDFLKTGKLSELGKKDYHLG